MLYKYFHDHVKDLRDKGGIPLARKDWPEEWKTVYFKEYPRFPKVKLELPEKMPDFSLFQAFEERKTERDFGGEAIDLEDLGQLLICGAGIQEKIRSTKSEIRNNFQNSKFPPKTRLAIGGKIQNSANRRSYPSGGARYPIELYPLVFMPSENLTAGIYHFNFKENSLENLWPFGENKDSVLETLLGGEWKNAALVILMSSVWHRTMAKYQDFGYRLIWAECGHIGQNFYLISASLGLKCSAVAGVNEDYANELLDLDGESESALMAYVFGQ